MKIREANKKDFEKILELIMGNMRHHMKINRQDWESLEKIRKEESKELKKDLKSPKTKIFVAEEKNEIAGYVTFSFHGKNSYARTKKKGEIDDLFVIKKFRRKGLGKALVGKALKHFKSNGTKSVALSVNSGNFPALEFYEKFGFKEVVKRMVLRI